MAGKKFTTITRKINFIIIISLIIGIGIIIAGSFYVFFTTTNNQIVDNLTQQSEILYKTIENLMIPGEAPFAVDFFEDINLVNPEYTIKLFRTTGQKAFTDNSTIQTVNNNIDKNQLQFDKFEERSAIIDDQERPIEDKFQPVVGLPPQTILFQTSENEKFLFRIYRSLINLPRCSECHGSDHTIRGVIDIRNDITGEVLTQIVILAGGGVIFLIIVIGLAIILTQFMKNTVIRPVKIIGNVCTGVTQGEFDQRVSIKNHDEIGILGNTVNTMVEGLYERFKLSKFVSSSTIKSLKAEDKGKKIPLTIFFSDIRGFTTYTEQNLPEKVVESLNRLLNFQTEIIQQNSGDIDKYVGDEIVAIYTEDNPELAACKTALYIQNELETKSVTDYNSLKVGIGINCGEVILGMIGSENRADYTIIGDNVNVASRLCNVAKEGQIIISQSVFQNVKDQVKVEGPYKIKVKGKKDFLRVYLLKSIKGS